MAVAVYLLGLILPFSMLLKLILQIGAGAAIVFLFCELTQFKDYIFVKNLIVEKIKEFKETRKKR